MFWWQRSEAGVELSVTSRAGGSSTGPYAGLNLGGRVGDAPDAVEANRAEVAAAVGVAPDRLLFMAQCHGGEVAVVEGPHAGDAPGVDALVTNRPGLALAALVADCTPILLWDEGSGAIGVAHCGRPGLAAGVVAATVAALRDLGATDLHAVVGPSVCGRCYEVPATMREEVASVAPASFTVSRTGTAALDVAAGVVEQLACAGVVVDDWVSGCTREEPDLYSYRRDGTTGRFAGIVVRRS